MANIEYWRASLEELFDGHGLPKPSPDLIQDIVMVADMEGEACGYHTIPNPLKLENNQLKQKIKNLEDEYSRRELIFRKNIAKRINPKLDEKNVFLNASNEIELWDR